MRLVFQDKGSGVLRVITGTQKKQEEEAMKKQIAELSKAEREKVEAEYHRMKPEEFDELMSRAKPRTANVANGSAARTRSKRKNKSTEKKRAA